MDKNLSRVTHINLASGFRGGERQTLLLMDALSERGFNQSLICRKNSDLHKKAERIKNLEINVTGLSTIACIRYFFNKGALHFHESRAFFALWLSTLFSRKNYLITRRVQRLPKNNVLNSSIYQGASFIVALTHNISENIDKSLDLSLDCQIINSAHSSLSFNELNVEKIKSEFRGKFVVGHIGALDDSHKGQHQIFSLAEKMQKIHPSIIFLLVGGGRDEKEFLKKAKKLSNLKVIGFVENVGDYMKVFDVFLFPSRHEGLGSILLDALAFGLPIIASNMGGIPEIIEHNNNGYLVEVDSIDDYMSWLLILFSNKEIYEKIKVNNIEKSKNYTVDQMTNSYIEIYKQMGVQRNGR
jgi:glycosyltransferase involved in cell wall biosynthesis